jgi:hypothetical protein
MATKMKMVMKGGKSVPAFAADGKGKMQMGGVKKLQKGGPVDGPMEARRKIMGEKKPSLKKTLRYVRKNGSGYIPSSTTSTTKKMQDGGQRVTGRDIRDAQRAAKLARINAGTEPSAYQKVSDIAGKVANVATTVGQGINAVKDIRGGNNDPSQQKRGGSIKLKKAMYGTAMKPAMMKKGGVKKMQKGGSTEDWVRDKIQGGLDWILGSDKLRAAGKSADKYLHKVAAPGEKWAYNQLSKPANAIRSALTPTPKKKVNKSQMGGATKKYQNGGPVISSKQYASILKNGKSIPATKRKKI